MREVFDSIPWQQVGQLAGEYGQAVVIVVLLFMLRLGRQAKAVATSFVAELCRLMRERPEDWQPIRSSQREGEPNYNALRHAGTGYVLHIDTEGVVTLQEPKVKLGSRRDRRELAAAYQYVLAKRLESSDRPETTAPSAEVIAVTVKRAYLEALAAPTLPVAKTAGPTPPRSDPRP